uniref:Uncharacterized protein n=1 Tax=Panagrellus redivivus TaxID=6233 RepID=A0A7E4W2P0_PANRE
MNGRLGAVIVLTLVNVAFADEIIRANEDLPSYLRGAVSFDETGTLKLHGYKEDTPHITFNLTFNKPVVTFHLCTQPRSLCSLPVDDHQRAVFCLKTESNQFLYKDECPPGMSGVEIITENADAGSFLISNDENGAKVPIRIENCAKLDFEIGDAYNYDYMILRTNPEVKFETKKLKILERANIRRSEILYFKNTNPKCGVYLLLNDTLITTNDNVGKLPSFFDPYFTVPPSPPPTNATEAEDEEAGEAVASAAVPVLKIVFIVVGVVVILVFVFVFFFLLYQRKKRKEYQAQSLSDKTPPLLLPKGSSNDVVAPVTPEKAPIRTPAPSAEMQSTPGASKQPPSTAVAPPPPSTDQKSATNSAVTAFQPPRGLRAMRTADELYRLALTADVRVERNVYLDLAIESANDEINAWEKSPAGKRNDTSILPLVAQRIISARQRKLTMLQSKIPNRLLPEQVDGLSYEDINDLALIEMKSMNIRYALFDMACDAIKRAYEEAYATASFDKESVDPLVYQVQLGVLELNEEPLRVAEQRRRLVEDYLRLKGIIVKEGFNSKSR